MITITTGNILESDADCLINTVNCEGYMGKGIAYQFKKAFPENNLDYIKACKSGNLTVGKIHVFKEKNKIIVNFPTKDKWREKSKIWYIEKGMDELVNFINTSKVKSVAIPPLGCGNGGLKWDEVQDILVSRTKNFSEDINVIIYAPTLKNIKVNSSKAPKLNLSHLILMKYKMSLKKFGKIRLQKTAFFMNLFMNKEYFNFKPQTYGPYAHSIEILSKDIQEYQEYYQKDTNEAFTHAVNVLISEKVKKELYLLDKTIKKATELVNNYTDTSLLELAATICYIIKNNDVINEDDIINHIQSWSNRKKSIYDESTIIKTLRELQSKGLITKDLIKFKITFTT